MSKNKVRALAALAGVMALLSLSACSDQGEQSPVVFSSDRNAPPDRAPANQTPRVIVLTINFDLNSHQVKPEARQELDNLAIALNDPTQVSRRFEVQGHTDVSGRLARNLALSELRAAAVKDYLVTKGVAADRLTPKGFGPNQLLTPETPNSPRNRRVEIVPLQ